METRTSDRHRPWPAPHTPWVLRQAWNHTIFAHWRFPPEKLRHTLPAPLQPFLDTHDGSAWLGIIGFRATDTRMRGLPSIPRLSDFIELNVRTYVTIDGKPGVYFHSLDTFHLLAVAGARTFFELSYFPATTDFKREGDGFTLRSERWSKRGADFEARYRPVGPPTAANLSPLTAFLAERYCLYTCNEEGNVARAEINHPPWLLSGCEYSQRRNTMMAPLGLELPDDAPLCHYAARQEALIWRPRRVATRAAAPAGAQRPTEAPHDTNTEKRRARRGKQVEKGAPAHAGPQNGQDIGVSHRRRVS